MKKFFSTLVLFFLIFSYAFVFTAPGALAKCYCYCGNNVGTADAVADDDTACNNYCVGLVPTKTMNSAKPCSANIITQSGGSGACPSGQVCLTDPLSLGGDPTKFFGRLIGALLAFVGVASLITFVYAGFMFLTSTGNQEQVKKAKDTMIYAVIGAAVSMGSYAILSYVFDILQNSTK